MTYDEIKALALSYADREDAEVSDRIDDFIVIVESRINRMLEVRKMSTRTQTTAIADQEYYGLPADFSGIRDIEISDLATGKFRQTRAYLTPDQMKIESAKNVISGTGRQVYYTIVADQFQIYPPVTDKTIEIIYYQNLPPLTSVSPDNWLSFFAPDAYVFGILTEINSFVKDAQTSALWDQRFNEVVKQLDYDDARDRWSGTPMQIRNT